MPAVVDLMAISLFIEPAQSQPTSKPDALTHFQEREKERGNPKNKRTKKSAVTSSSHTSPKAERSPAIFRRHGDGHRDKEKDRDGHKDKEKDGEKEREKKDRKRAYAPSTSSPQIAGRTSPRRFLTNRRDAPDT